MYRPYIIAAIESAEVELTGGLGRPQAQGVDHIVLVAGNEDVVSQGHDILGIDPPHERATVLVRLGFDSAIIVDGEENVGPSNIPRTAVTSPIVDSLRLGTIDDQLAEDAVLIEDAIAHGRDAECGHRLEKTGRETAKTTVS